MPRIKPDNITQHGRHTDYFWPGVIHSVWTWRGFLLRRERTYADRNHQRLAKTAWQLHYERPRRRGGLRYEVDEFSHGRLS
jgi:hypothetical protein